MTGTFRDFPDAEQVAIDWLASDGIDAAASLPASPTWPCLVVTRIGGTTNEFRAADMARLQLDAYGADRGSARDLLAATLTRLWSLAGAPGLDAEVLDVQPDLGMTWQPDTSLTPNRPRYIAGVVVTLR